MYAKSIQMIMEDQAENKESDQSFEEKNNITDLIEPSLLDFKI